MIILNKILLVICSIILIKCYALSEELKPFGIELGKKLNKNIVLSEVNKQGNIRIVLNPLKPIGLFETYAVELSKENKVVVVYGIGKSYLNDSYCLSSQSDFSKVESILNRKYGISSDKSDFLYHDAIWKDARDYKMSLIKNERINYSKWENIKDFPNNSIFLIESADNGGCFIKIMYIDKKLNKIKIEEKNESEEDSL